MGVNEAWLIPAIPFAAFVVLLLFGPYIPRRGDWLSIAAIAASFVLFFPVLVDFLGNSHGTEFVPGDKVWTWISFDGWKITLGFFTDQIAIVMLAVVTVVTLCVQVYSLGYMRGDSRYGWYYTAMSLFAASMLTLVLADNLLLLYVAWELVGFCSFLLIGFWWERRSAAEAAKKAFITTRIGDVGFLIGIIMLWREAGTFNITQIFEFARQGGYGDTYLTAAVLLLFAGAVGKSAQFPLHVWLPDAMEGPTPVSALIHAATMVVAGVYMVARMLPLFEMADALALDIVLALGLVTVVLSATMGLAATDIKRIIAYSTLNSLGLMFVALGSHSTTAAMFYLLVHGYFKGLLFLSSGSVIHATEKQDINELGGLAEKMPVTAAVMGIGTLAMIGVVPFSGFWAKDEILNAAWSDRTIVVWLIVMASLVVTALYMTRMWVRTFLFEPRDRHAWEHAHDAEPAMTWPLIALAALTVVGGFVAFDFVGKALGFPGGIGKFVFATEPEGFHVKWGNFLGSTALVLGGVAIGYWIWQRQAEIAHQMAERFRPVYLTLANRYYIDDIYQFAINRIVLAAGGIIAWFDRTIVNDTGVDGSAGIALGAGFEIKFLETGKLPNYALGISLGVIVVAVIFLVFVI